MVDVARRGHRPHRPLRLGPHRGDRHRATSRRPTGSPARSTPPPCSSTRSTRFVDGEEFGFGAEIGISTQKLHARGPMGLRELTTAKYVVHGDGQVRGDDPRPVRRLLNPRLRRIQLDRRSSGRYAGPMAYRFESVPAVRDGLPSVDYLADEGIAGVVYLADRLRQAGPGRGAGRHRQDPAGQVGGRDDRRPADPPAVLRGPRRVQGAVRVELQEAAAAHPGRAQRRRRAGATSRTTSSPRSSCSPARCSRPSAPTSRSCC